MIKIRDDQIYKLFECSPGDFIINSYELIFERKPDLKGLLHYSSRLKIGIPRWVLVAEMFSSIEGYSLIENINSKECKKIISRYRLVRRLPIGALRWTIHLPFYPVQKCPEDKSFLWDNWMIEYISNHFQHGFPVSEQNTLEDIVVLSDNHKSHGPHRFNIQPAGNSRFDYLATNDDPYFYMPIKNLKEGYYDLSFKNSQTEIPVNILKIYAVYSDGRVDPNPILVASILSEKKYNFLFYLYEGVEFLRIDPVECKQFFSQPLIDLSYISDVIGGDDLVLRGFLENFDDIYHSNKLILYNGMLPSVSDYRVYLNESVEYVSQNFDYINWIAVHEKNYFKKVLECSSPAKKTNLPFFSVVIPVYNPQLYMLTAAIESVLNQSFCNFELILADDCSSDSRVRQILEDYRKRDDRIKLVLNDINGGISLATNSGLKLASGSYVCFMDHDDTLSELALQVYYNAIDNSSCLVKCLYCDEDKIDIRGNRSNPFFKPDFSPERLLSHNYITHFLCLHKQSFESVLYLRKECDGAQDYDLLLRLMDDLDPSNCIHIAYILYHWRSHPESTAMVSSAKNYSLDAGFKALYDYSVRSNTPALIRSLGDNFFRFNCEGVDEPIVDIIIPFRDNVELTKKCFESIVEYTKYPNYHITFIDNLSSNNETLKFIRYVKSVFNRVDVLRYSHEFNWASINNFAAMRSQGDILLFLNNDIEAFEYGWLEQMISQLIKSSSGVVGNLLLYPDFTIQHAGVVAGLGGSAGHIYTSFPSDSTGYTGELLTIRNVSAVTGACLMVRKSVFDLVGGFDENFRVAFNDVDFCFSILSKGYRNIFTPHSRLIHYESKSRGYEDTPEKQRRFNAEVKLLRAKWPHLMASDPYYNPNLTKSMSNCSINRELFARNMYS